MRIAKIVRIHGVGVFQDFGWPSGAPEFARYNLIYGWNGTGKTTLSGLFADLGAGRSPAEGEATLRVDGSVIDEAKFADAERPIRVFNRDFVERNVFRIDGKGLPSVKIALGEENVEAQKQIDDLRPKLEAARVAGSTAKTDLETAETDVRKRGSDRAKSIKEWFRALAYGPYADYDRPRYDSTHGEIAQVGNHETQRLSEDALASVRSQLATSMKESLTELRFAFPDLMEANGSVNELLQRQVQPPSIPSLRDDHDVSTWVRRGVELHVQRQTDTCLYCDQHVPAHRRDALLDAFNEEVGTLSQDLEDELASLRDAKESLRLAPTLHDSARFYEELKVRWDDVSRAYGDAKQSSISWIDVLSGAVEQRQASLFEPIEVVENRRAVGATPVNQVNEVIRQHNESSEHIERNKKAAARQAERHFVAESYDDRIGLEAEVKRREKARNDAADELKRIEMQLSDLRRSLDTDFSVAEDLSRDLGNYLGHSDLALVAMADGYVVTRNAQIATGLSEGEKTAIALLYFLKTLEEQTFDIGTGVVVLDDPVSSLDAQSLYHAFGLIRDRTNRAGQLFVLTHNWSFFRSVQRWFRGKNRGTKQNAVQPACFYTLDCEQVAGHRQAKLREMSRPLAEHETEYLYLFSRVWRAAVGPRDTGAEAYYLLPNAARRLLETFLAFKYPAAHASTDQGLAAILENVSPDPAHHAAIVRLLDVYSHGNAVPTMHEDVAGLGEVHSVLKDVIAVIEAADPGHLSGLLEATEEARTA